MKISSFLVSSALLAAAVVIPGSAQALDITKPLEVRIQSPTKPDGVDVGELHCFQESVQLVDVGFQEFCRYPCKWVNNADEQLSANIYIDERIVAGYADCDENATQEFFTDLQLAPGLISKGFDRHNAKRTVKALILGAGLNNAAVGSIAFENGGYPQYHGIKIKKMP